MNKFIKKVLFTTPLLSAVGSVGVYFGLSTTKEINDSALEDNLEDEIIPIEPTDEDIYDEQSTQKEETPKTDSQVQEKTEPTSNQKPTNKTIVEQPRPRASSTNELGIKIFPTINQASYYKYIRFQESEPFITDEFISHVVNDILLKMQYTDGKVYWSYEFSDPIKRKEVVISFRLHPTGNGFLRNEIRKSYHFTLKKA